MKKAPPNLRASLKRSPAQRGCESSMRWVKGGEVSPSGLVEKLGMKPEVVSNQLQRLSYRIVDPCVIDLIDRCLCLLEDVPTSQAIRRP
jgi:hypothetical protein